MEIMVVNTLRSRDGDIGSLKSTVSKGCMCYVQCVGIILCVVGCALYVRYVQHVLCCV